MQVGHASQYISRANSKALLLNDFMEAVNELGGTRRWVTRHQVVEHILANKIRWRAKYSEKPRKKNEQGMAKLQNS
jgi:hypothetical protein